MAVKVFYIISDIEKALSFEWITKGIDKTRFELHFILLGKDDTPFISFLKGAAIPHYVILFRGKKDILKAWLKVFLILRKQDPRIVHTHLYSSNLIGLSAAWCLRIPKRIYTRHHASIHHRYFPKTVYIDRIINFLSTDIVALCDNLKEILIKWEGVSPKKIHLIPNGFDLDYFESIDPIKVKALRMRYKIPDTAYPVVGVIARFTEWKGVQYCIPAFKALLKEFPHAHLILANATGDYAARIKLMLDELPVGSYTTILFEEDSASLYKVFNVYVHTPIDSHAEAFGQTYVEALAGGVPSVFTLSGIACDFIRHKENALVVGYAQASEISGAVSQLLKDPALQERLIRSGRETIKERFSIHEMIRKMEELYVP